LFPSYNLMKTSKQIIDSTTLSNEKWVAISTLTGVMSDHLKLDNIRPYYSVSNFGRVMNIEQGNILSLEGKENKYQRAAMRVINGKTPTTTRKINVNRLVALAFLGEPSDIKMQVDHINRNKSDNHVNNLRWVTARENCNNKGNTGRQKKEGKIWFDGVSAYFTEDDLNSRCNSPKEAKLYEFSKYNERLTIEDSFYIPDELWTFIRVGDNDYLVSDKGRVFIKYYKKKTYGTMTESGYLNIGDIRVHRLVALAFLEEQLESLGEDVGKYVVYHKDNNRLNNDSKNLMWCSTSDVLDDTYRIGAKKTRPIARTNKNGDDRRDYKSIKSAVDALNAKDKNKSRKAIDECIKRNSEKDIPTHQSQGFIWFYI
jgi:hypothetical protein